MRLGTGFYMGVRGQLGQVFNALELAGGGRLMLAQGGFLLRPNGGI